MLGLLSDAHGNLAGFLEGMSVLERHGARRFAFLGDAVGYIPSWDVVDELSRRRDEFSFVLGNHEQALLSGTISSKDRVYRHGTLIETATPERIAFLSSWSRSISLDLPCGTALLVHGSPDDPQNGYLYPDTPLDDLRIDAAFVFCGHTHRPFIRAAGTTHFINIGSCGLPRDDGRFGSVALLDEQSGEVRVVRYDMERSTGQYLKRFADVDASIKDLLTRRSPNIFGKSDI
jgi:predicted phosphodiesterase